MDHKLLKRTFINYKTLRVLLDKSDKTEFENVLSCFLCKLENEPAMQNFKKYYVSTQV